MHKASRNKGFTALHGNRSTSGVHRINHVIQIDYSWLFSCRSRAGYPRLRKTKCSVSLPPWRGCAGHSSSRNLYHHYVAGQRLIVVEQEYFQAALTSLLFKAYKGDKLIVGSRSTYAHSDQLLSRITYPEQGLAG